MESWGFSDKHNVHLGIARARRRPGCAKRAKRRMATKREYRHYVPRLVGLGPPDLKPRPTAWAMAGAGSPRHDLWCPRVAGQGCCRETPDLLAWLRREMPPQDVNAARGQDFPLAWHRAWRIEPAPPYRFSSSG
jgi:hypothetical protein